MWFYKNLTVELLNARVKDTMGAHIGLEWVEIGDDFLRMRMPVNDKTKQPFGILHGGASCALAESIGSMASYLTLDPEKYYCVGLEINANHIRSVRDGYVTATCRPLHIGRKTHVWDIRIESDEQKLVCVSRLTVAILEKDNG
jgi:1,4-dihydroxy-2-naphthoyl-CoA hydrolase